MPHRHIFKYHGGPSFARVQRTRTYSNAKFRDFIRICILLRVLRVQNNLGFYYRLIFS